MKGAFGYLASASIKVETTVKNDYLAEVTANVTSEIFNPDGISEGTVSTILSIASNGTQVSTQTINLKQANLWSIDYPNLYTVVITIQQNGEIKDTVSTIIGIRKIHWDVNNGFLLNDQPVKIKGMANHQDFAGVGVAVPDSLQVFRISKLKQMGANAWRTAHNPPNAALLDLADKLGFLVWDENHILSDSAETQEDVRRLVLRDRNHPSIIMWSLCNEALCNGEGTERAREVGTLLKSIIRQYDDRPVTAAMNAGWGSGLSYVIDIQGFNYAIYQYDTYHKSHTTQPLIGSETASTVSDRGIYQTNATAAYVSAYDVNYPSWGATVEGAWQPIANRSFMSGCFVWTGFDYKGEPTPYGWPNINSHFGTIDIAGFEKDNYWYYWINWGERNNGLHLYPHWNWNVGQDVDVWAFAGQQGEKVELFVNGKSVGKQNVTPLGHVSWMVQYEPGFIECRLYDASGKQVNSQTITTTGSPSAISLRLDLGQNGLLANGQDVALIAASVVDDKGNVVPTANNEIQFQVVGEGKLIGIGSGDPSSHESDKSNKRRAFNGLVRAIVQATQQQGEIVVMVTSLDGKLKPDKVVIQSTKPKNPFSII
eukprot:TRINITY_DN2141_c1_g1_i1.p1 TRINITY_DN2141_c1_g1~~TRINITY_DN2141_c1_g1_i1.p1  ORF type:complete len:649 (-),score=153.23 TRINITY_DN2141_c1_g1_i1:63-1853(-)